jgi:hypothetical protein
MNLMLAGWLPSLCNHTPRWTPLDGLWYALHEAGLADHDRTLLHALAEANGMMKRYGFWFAIKNWDL